MGDEGVYGKHLNVAQHSTSTPAAESWQGNLVAVTVFNYDLLSINIDKSAEKQQYTLEWLFSLLKLWLLACRQLTLPTGSCQNKRFPSQLTNSASFDVKSLLKITGVLVKQSNLKLEFLWDSKHAVPQRCFFVVILILNSLKQAFFVVGGGPADVT